MPGQRLAPLVLLLLGVLCADASAAVRWADAGSAVTTGACPAEAPCRVDHAVDGAAEGDEVVLAPGTYTLAAPLTAAVPLTLRGAAGEPRPHLSGSVALPAGGTLRHLSVSAATGTAVAVSGATAEDLLVTASAGPALQATGAAGRTLVRDALLVTTSASPGTAALLLDGAGEIAARNLTVWAGAGAAAVRCAVSGAGTASLVNVLARGTAADVDATGNGARCSAAWSSFRPGASPGIGLARTNQAADPLLVDPVAGDFRQAAGSPTIDAGTPDALLGATDPDGVARTVGAAPDIGAYEAPAPTAASAGTPAAALPSPVTALASPKAPAAVPAPALGRTVVLGVARGAVRVKEPGGRRFVALTDAASLPVGTVVDTRAGAVRLASALTGGRRQDATFSGGVFTVRQDRQAKGVTDIVLTGGTRAGCPRSRLTARAAGRRRPIRRLWGSDRGGRFRTHGSDSVATVRGTRWLTEDRCEGTFTKVASGAVDVRDKHTGRTRRVRAGQTVLVRRR